MPTETLEFVAHKTRTFDSGKTVNKFQSSDGRWFDVWRAPVASVGISTLTKPVVVTYETKINGTFTNHDISEIAPVDSSTGVKVGAGSDTPGEVSSAPAPAARQVDWDAKDQRITRSFSVNAALKALEITGGDIPNAEIVLKAANELAQIPARYAWDGTK